MKPTPLQHRVRNFLQQVGAWLVIIVFCSFFIFSIGWCLMEIMNQIGSGQLEGSWVFASFFVLFLMSGLVFFSE